MSTSEWRSSAACRSIDPDLFFPCADSGPTYAEQVRAAKAVCGSCLVRDECLAEALERIPDGIAGGLTPDERRRFRDRRAPSKTEVLETGLRPGARRVEVEAAGRLLLDEGHSAPEVARRCGVSERPVARWKGVRRGTSTRAEGRHLVVGEGSAVAAAAPLRISRSHGQAGTRVTEGHRS